MKTKVVHGWGMESRRVDRHLMREIFETREAADAESWYGYVIPVVLLRLAEYRRLKRIERSANA